MEPVTLILTALVTGATAAAQSVGSEVLKDAYTGLKSLIQRKFAGNPSAEKALDKYTENPEGWKAPLEDSLRETEADEDQAILEQARKVMSHFSQESNTTQQQIINYGKIDQLFNIGTLGILNVDAPRDST